tara:strand:- start:367 stop:480 length:114 start_codon:yes stop_codon:yes gene_type:complete
MKENKKKDQISKKETESKEEIKSSTKTKRCDTGTLVH